MSSSDNSSSRASSSPEPAARKSGDKKRKAHQPEIEVDLALPEPPSKRAKRALKKGKPLPPKPDSDDDEDEAEPRDAAAANKDDDSKTAKKERSPYGVWIGNLRFTVTREELRQWLVDNSGGSITAELVTRVHMPRGKRGAAAAAAAWENKGFAYVDFATYEANLAAIALSETEWYRRRLLIKDATNFEGRPKKEDEDAAAAAGGGGGKKDQQKQPEEPVSTSRKIFVGNLGFQATEDDVRELFSRCGEIEWAKLATFEDSGKCKGYGWVKFAEAVAADWAVKGFVKIKEVEETEEDFVDEEKAEDDEESESEESGSGEDDSASDSDSDSSSDKKKKPTKKPIKKPIKKPKAVPEKKVKMRKWWINTLHGRRLKIEHAEDDQTRYKKRYGKGAQQRQQQQGGEDGDGGGKKAHQGGDRPSHAARHNNSKPNKWSSRDGAHQDQNGRRPAAGREPADATNFREDIHVARLTGAAVKPEGKKTTFD